MGERQPMTVAFLGPLASFSHVASARFFEKEAVELLPQPTIPDCIEAVAKGEVTYALVPLENALEGSVPLTIDYLFHGTQLFMTAEVLLPIEQHLLIHPENKEALDQLESIQSHPHALAQCHQYLKESHKGVPLIQTTSTARAAELVSAHPEQKIAAVGNKLAAQTYQLEVAKENIHDYHFNHTRFVVLSRQKEQFVYDDRRSTPKTTLMVKLPEDDRPGRLHQILSVFSWRRLNLSKIESRPMKTGLGHYFFIIDVMQDEREPMMQGAYEELEALGCTIQSFGTYYVYQK